MVRPSCPSLKSPSVPRRTFEPGTIHGLGLNFEAKILDIRYNSPTAGPHRRKALRAAKAPVGVPGQNARNLKR